MDSDLNRTSPQFNLTCLSTGGPATNVTWTRDSDNVTEGTETVLDDPVTAQYTHTLTVTGRLGGLYTCFVANDKPSEAVSYITVQGVYTNDYCNNGCTNSMYMCMKKVHNLKLKPVHSNYWNLQDFHLFPTVVGCPLYIYFLVYIQTFFPREKHNM